MLQIVIFSFVKTVIAVTSKLEVILISLEGKDEFA
jgi:hypothetical protein